MKIANVVFGLPGSGKTTFAKHYLSNCDLFLDDLTILSKNVSIEVFFEDVLLKNKDIKVLTITDPMLCLKKNQEKLESILIGHGFSINWYFINLEAKECEKRSIHNANSTILLLKNNIYLNKDKVKIIVPSKRKNVL